MRVAAVSFDFGEYSIRLASALSEHAEVLLLLNETLAGPFLPLLDRKVSYRPIPRVRHRQAFRQVKRNHWLLQQIRDFRPDVVHLQQGTMWFNIALQFEDDFPIVLTVHDAQRHIGDRLSRKTPYFFSKMAFHRADRLIAHNQYVKNMLHEGLGLAEEKIHIVPHIQLGKEPQATRRSDDGKTVLFFGRIWPYKGLDCLIRAEPWVTKQIPDVNIVIAGQGESFERYRQIMVNPERFTVLNQHVSDEDSSRLFDEASIVVLPYIEASQSGVIPVAYTHSKPVIATTVGGLPEMVEHGVTGFLVPPCDERKLADAIVMALGDEDRRRRMGDAGRSKVERECSSAVIARQTVEVYQAALYGERKLQSITA